MARTILHVDLDAFFCSVEELLNPELRGKAFVVGGSPEGRGVVSSASYASRKYGIRSAMPTAQALRLCPDLVVVRHRSGEYGEYSGRVMELLRRSAPLVQQISIDEAFLDVTDHPSSGAEVARLLQGEILDRLRLPTSWGVASNKLVAKIATEVGKPRGLVVVPPGEEASFLAPLPVQMLWGVGPKTEERLAELGVRTIGDLAAIPESRLVSMLGSRGRELATMSLGQDSSPVVEEREARSMSAEVTFSRDVNEGVKLRGTLRSLSEQVGRRLRKAELAGATVRLKVRWPDFSTITRQVHLDNATDHDGEIYAAALELLEKVWRPGKDVRLIGVGVSDLGPPVRQLSLFDRSWERDARLLEALDRIREKYGRRAVRRGRFSPRRGKAQESDLANGHSTEGAGQEGVEPGT